jgi:hypothetical protein
MLIAGFNLLVGVACGLRLTLLPFILVMIATMVAVATLLFSHEAGLLSMVAQLALAAFCLQTGYVCGVLVRAWGD